MAVVGFRYRYLYDKCSLLPKTCLTGQAAAEFLLKGTKQITSPKESVFRMFQKSGSLQDAMNDFRSVNPSYVWEYKNQYGVCFFIYLLNVLAYSHEHSRGFPIVYNVCASIKSKFEKRYDK